MDAPEPPFREPSAPEFPAAVFVDLDDVLAETAESLLALLWRRTGRRLGLEHLRDFDLERSLALSGDAFHDFMRAAHSDDELHRIAPRAGAAHGLEAWVEAGLRIEIMTGRPPSTEPASRAWLARHGLAHHDLDFVDKYGRPDWRGEGRRGLPLEALAERGYVMAVEDSPRTALFLACELRIPVALLDRPWNRDLRVPPGAEVVRCRDWTEVRERLPDRG